MDGERPSNLLMLMLVGSLLLAGWMYGRPLLLGPDDLHEDFVEPSDLGFLDDDDVAEDLQSWTPPENPRNPFLPVDIGTPPAAAAEADGD